MMIAVIWSCRGILDQLAFNFLFLSFSLVFEKRKGKIYLYLLYISIERERERERFGQERRVLETRQGGEHIHIDVEKK
jgi:hypothetical protein